MATEFKGRYYETVVVSLSNETFIVDKKTEMYGGGVLSDDIDSLIGFGIVEDPTLSGLGGNTYRVNGRVVGMASGIATFGDDTRILLGKGAEVAAGLGIGSSLGSPVGGDYQAALAAYGDSSRVSIARGAGLEGLMGVMLGGVGSTATNAGTIHAGLIGMSAGDFFGSASGLANMKLANSGGIEAYIGMLAAYVDGVRLENGEKGEIIAFAAGVMTMSSDDMQADIRNAGTIRVLLRPDDGNSLSAVTAAIVGGEGDETITNTGRIFGDLMLGGGDDFVNNVGGRIRGDITGGAGADTLVVSRPSDILVELADEGVDTVRSTVSYMLPENVEYLLLTGTRDIDATGNAITNILLGNRGDNVLTGLGGVDIFAFRTGGGRDTIADFGDGADVINLSRWKGIDDFADVLSHARDVGDDVRIRLDGDTLVIAGHHKTDLDESNFSWLS